MTVLRGIIPGSLLLLLLLQRFSEAAARVSARGLVGLEGFAFSDGEGCCFFFACVEFEEGSVKCTPGIEMILRCFWDYFVTADDFCFVSAVLRNERVSVRG